MYFVACRHTINKLMNPSTLLGVSALDILEKASDIVPLI
jgi:hypothetical protein